MNALGSVAQVMAQTLKAYDTKHFFLLTGGDQDLWIALRDADIQMVLARSERSAAYMADAYARLTRKPAFTYGQFGPGAAVMVGGIVDPYWAGAPVIVITSSSNTMTRYKSEYQELDQKPLFQPITKMNVELPRPDRAAEILRSAIRAAVTGNPGPVHIDVPMDVFGADAGDPPIYAEPRFAQYPPMRPSPNQDDIEKACKLLVEADRPVAVAGMGVVASQAWDELTELSESLGLPVATTMGGKGSIAETHSNSVGVVGRYSRKSVNEIVSESDVVLAVGCTLGALATDTFQIPSRDAKIIHIDIDPTVLGTAYREEVSIEADAKAALTAMLEYLSSEHEKSGANDNGWLEHVNSKITAWREAYAEAATKSQLGAIAPHAVFQSLQEVLQPQDVVVADTGYMGAWAGALYEVKAPGSYFIRTGGSLGWAFPAALGAQVARPRDRVVSIIGDGGVGYHIGDMETAKRLNLPVVVLILNNRSLAFEYHIQKYLFDTEVSVVNDFYDTNYADVARAFGWSGKRIEEATEITGALREALDSGEPAVVEVMIDKEATAPVTYYESVVERAV
jgi:acetolactate synthase I/II/III large subunit